MEQRRRRGISSSLGSVSFVDEDLFESRQPIVVEDATPDEPVEEEILSNIKTAHKEKQVEANRLPKETIRSLEVLFGIGRLSKEVEVEGVTFSIRSLKSKQMRNVLSRVILAENKIEEMFLTRAVTLGLAIYAINNIPIENYVDQEDIEAVIQFVDNLEESTVTILYEEYSSMINHNKNNIKENVGSTPEEVIENIKKS